MTAAPPDCVALAPLLALVAEGEASPSERLNVSQHTGRCTRCRILLAREQRLSEALEELVQVDDEALARLIEGQRDGGPPLGFSAQLMRQLEKPSTKKKFRRGLRLATPFGMVGLALLALGANRGFGFIAAQEQSLASGEAITLAGGRLGSLLQMAWGLIGSETGLATLGVGWIPRFVLAAGSLLTGAIAVGAIALILATLTVTLIETVRRAA